MTWAKIAHFAMVKKLVVVMDERIVALHWARRVADIGRGVCSQ